MPSLPLAVARTAASLQHQPDGCAGAAIVRHAVVTPEERAAAGGVRVLRGRSAPRPVRCSWADVRAPPLINLPFFIAGTLKIVYDVLLYSSSCRAKRPRKCGAESSTRDATLTVRPAPTSIRAFPYTLRSISCP